MGTYMCVNVKKRGSPFYISINAQKSIKSSSSLISTCIEELTRTRAQPLSPHIHTQGARDMGKLAIPHSLTNKSRRLGLSTAAIFVVSCNHCKS